MMGLLTKEAPPRTRRLVSDVEHPKPRVREYPGWGMTLCIAARFRLGQPYMDPPVPAFVLCTDGRLGEDEWGSQDATVKTHAIGYNFLALMCGHWSGSR